MEWLNNTVCGGRGKRKFFYGLGPDDSLNSSSSDDDDTYKNSATDTSFSSKESSINIPISINITGWRTTEYKPPFYFEEQDFARFSIDAYNKRPTIIRLYNGQSGPRAQIGNLENVLMTEMEECYKHQQLSSSNLLLIIENVEEQSFPYYEEGLTRLLSSFCNNKENYVLRCVLWMECYYKAPLFSEILSSYCCNLLELNIGARRLPELPLRHPPYDFDEESDRVISLLKTWLPANKNTIRCLRLYTFLHLDKPLTTLVNGCPKLRHLTLSKVVHLNTCCELSNIETFELDKQSLSYIDDDITFMKKVKGIFSNVRKIRITGNNFSPLVENLVIRLGLVKNGNYEIYQDELDLEEPEKLIRSTSRLFTKATKKDSQSRIKAIHFKNQTSNSNIYLFNGSYTYPTIL